MLKLQVEIESLRGQDQEIEMLPAAHAIQWDIRFGNVDRNQIKVAQDLFSRVTTYFFPRL